MALEEAYNLAIITHRALAVLSALQMCKENKVLVSVVFIVRFTLSYMGSGPYKVLKETRNKRSIAIVGTCNENTFDLFVVT